MSVCMQTHAHTHAHTHTNMRVPYDTRSRSRKFILSITNQPSLDRRAAQTPNSSQTGKDKRHAPPGSPLFLVGKETTGTDGVETGLQRTHESFSVCL